MQQHENTKYQHLLEWIDALPSDEKFNFAQAAVESKVARKSVGIIVLPILKKGLLTPHVKNCRVKCYTKSDSWNLKDAMQINIVRLEVKAKIKKQRKASKKA